ncbi:MAG: hypothetical protein IPJ58_16335 [Ardenticatenia bacterium]|nr:hypothetical protein [Ardenticatenia bacterium]
MRLVFLGLLASRPASTMRARALPLARPGRRGHEVTVIMPPWQRPGGGRPRLGGRAVPGLRPVNVSSAVCACPVWAT